MMIKLLVFIKKKPDISFEAFKTYYENNHVPLVKRLLPFTCHYRRNYLESGLSGEAETFDYDVVTELVFKSDEDYQDWLKTVQREEVLAEIRKDEANFLLSDETRLFKVDECGH